MIQQNRHRYLLLASMLACGLTWAGVSGAAACVPFPFVSVAAPANGPPGTQVTLVGSEFPQDPIEVRWNGSDGPTVATAEGPQFSVKVPIPESPVGLHTFVVLARAPDGGVSSKAGAAFYVTGADGVVPRPSNPVAAPGDKASQDGLGVGVAVVIGAALLALGFVGGAALRSRRQPGTVDAGA